LLLVAGGIVVALGRPGLAIGIDAITFLVSSALLLRLGHACRRPPMGQPALIRELLDGWSVVRSRGWLCGMIGLFGIFQFAVLGGLGVLGPLVARSRLGGAGAWGVMMSAAAVGALAGGALALRWRPRRLLLAANVSLLGVVPALIALSLAAPEAWEVAAMLVYGCATSYTDALWISAMQANVPVEMISRVSSYDWLGSTALYPIGLAVSAPVAAAIGTGNELRGIAAIMVAGVIVLLVMPGVRRIGIPDAKQEETLVVAAREL